jgi:DNA repair exonuclease SbcCD ATPase subunit
MRKITIQQLAYANFRGQTQSLTFAHRNEIKGRNGSGKTTVFNAIAWLLTGADLENRTNFRLFDETVEWSHETAPTISVKATFNIDSDTDDTRKELVLRKTAKQKWYQKRGQAEWYKDSSDEYKFYVDDVEVSATSYSKAVEDNFAAIGKLKLMLNQEYWYQIDWKDLRKQFQSVVGEITAEDFKGDYSSILPEITSTDVDSVKKKYSNLVNSKDKDNPGYAAQLDKNAIEIEMQQSALPDLSECDAAEARITELDKELQEIDEQLVGINTANQDVIRLNQQRQQELAKLRNEYREAESAFNDGLNAMRISIQRKLDDILAQNNKRAARKSDIESRLTTIDTYIRANKAKRTEMLAEYARVEAAMFDGICKYCGNAIIGAKRQQLLDDFHTKKESELARRKAEGKVVADAIARDETTYRELSAELESDTLQPLSAAEARKELADFDAADKDFTRTDVATSLQAKIDEVQSQVTDIPQSETTAQMLARKGEIYIERDRLILKRQLRDTYQRITDTIQRLQNEAKAIAQAKAECERKVILCEEYLKEQSDIIRYRTNKYFPERVRVEMQQRQKNGELSPTCQITIDGTDARVANTAAHREVGIAVSQAFQEFCDIEMFMFFDNASDFDSYHQPQVNGQILLAKAGDELPFVLTTTE